MQNKLKTLLLLTFIASFISCSLEQKVAIKIQKELPKTTILLSADPELYKANNKVYIPENISDDKYDELYFQSMDGSDFIGKIDIDAYWQKTRLEIESYMINSGLKYLPSDSITNFIDKDNPKFIFDIKQVEVDEYYVDFVETFSSSIAEYGYFNNNSETMEALDFKAIIDNYEAEVSVNNTQHSDEINQNYDSTTEYKVSFKSKEKKSDLQIIMPINAVSINYWIEVNSYLKNEGHKRELIYISMSMEDVITNDKEINYDDLINIQSWFKFANLGYRVDSINIDKIWTESDNWSMELTDILNAYILDRVIEDEIHKASDTKYRKRHWELNTKTGRVLPTDNQANYKILERFDND